MNCIAIRHRLSLIYILPCDRLRLRIFTQAFFFTSLFFAIEEIGTLFVFFFAFVSLNLSHCIRVRTDEEDHVKRRIIIWRTLDLFLLADFNE